MHKFLASSVAVAALSFTFVAHAELTPGIVIPEKVSSNILKRYPKAQDMQAAHETHFGQKLLEVSFKDEKGLEVHELFTAKGHLFTNELKVEDLSEILPPVIATLKKEFPDYTMQKAELIANPNGTGEEYEMYLNANGKDWKVFINDHGIILDKQQLVP